MAIAGLPTAGCPQVQGNAFVQIRPSYCVGSGTYQAVNEGVYVLLAPLSAGPHTIHFATPTMDVTYHLTVAP